MRWFIFIVVLVLWMSLHALVAKRLGAAIPKKLPRRLAQAGAIAAALLPLFWIGMRMADVRSDALMWVVYISMGFSVLLIVLTLVGEGAALVGGLFVRRAHSEDDDRPAEPSRRLFMQQARTLGATGGALALTGVGFHAATRVPEVTRVDVPIPNLPEALEGFRIAQLSDVHIGPTIKGDWLDAVVEVTNGLEPDMVALTGDLVDGHVLQLREDTAGFGRLRASHGVYYVTGNHEHYYDGEGWCRELARLGAVVLNNEHHVIEKDGAKLLIAGVPDYSGGGGPSDPVAAKRGAPEHDVSVLLAHQPRSIFDAVTAGFDLQLSGHTHGGQFFPANFIVHLVQPHVSGLEKRGDTQIFVSRGTGYWGPPNRVGSPSEIALLTLVRA